MLRTPVESRHCGTTAVDCAHSLAHWRLSIRRDLLFAARRLICLGRFMALHQTEGDLAPGAGFGLILRKRIWAKTSRKGGFVELLAAKYMRLTVLGYEHRLKHCG
jgi:hypothetical protein